MNPDLPDWESQRAFLAVLREGSLSGAARALGVAQPKVRRRLEALEQSVGTALFTRSPTGLTPTEAARTLGQYADAMATAAAAFTRAASADAGAAGGTVRITASDVIGAEVLPAILADLRRAHPGLVLELHLSNRNEDLPRFALIGPDRESGDLRALRAAGLNVQREMLAVRTASHLAQRGAGRAGLGIGVCQAALARREARLAPVLPDAFAAGLETWVAMHEDLRRVERVRVTFDHLVRSLSDYVADQ